VSGSPDIRSILAALDESPRAAAVFATAANLARRLEARLVLIRVVWLPPDIPPAAHAPALGVEGFVESQARSELAGLMQSAPDVDFGAPLVVEGDPWRQILKASDELDVDLIVMGNHRYHGLERMLGTVAAQVVNHARRNVMVVQDQRR
jgi:nucleotide-binding universal stress UspA family protein